MKDVRLLTTVISAGEEIARFASLYPDAGGVVSFIGQVRASDACEALELSHYEPMTLPGMRALADQALARWPLDGVLVVHRAGVMRPGDVIVVVAAASRHRRDSFQAADFLMDYLKSDAWFWKRELRAGEWHWVEPRQADYADIARWG